MKFERGSFEGWIPKAEAAKMTGRGLRTLERMAQKGEIKQAYRPVPGRRDLPVFHPDDIQKLITEQVAIVPEVGTPNLPAVRSRQVPAMSRREAEPIRLTEKFYLTLDEAAVLSGLPRALLERAVKSGELKGRKAGGWYIRREDLARF